MENEFVSYEESLDLKELGFDEPCYRQWIWSSLRKTHYLSDEWLPTTGKIIKAPLYQQAFRWFIINHNLYGNILPWSVKKLVDDKLVEKIVWYYSVEKLGKPSRYKPYEFTGDTPEDAMLECLKKLIEVIKEKP